MPEKPKSNIGDYSPAVLATMRSFAAQLLAAQDDGDRIRFGGELQAMFAAWEANKLVEQQNGEVSPTHAELTFGDKGSFGDLFAVDQLANPLTRRQFNLDAWKKFASWYDGTYNMIVAQDQHHTELFKSEQEVKNFFTLQLNQRVFKNLGTVNDHTPKVTYTDNNNFTVKYVPRLPQGDAAKSTATDVPTMECVEGKFVFRGYPNSKVTDEKPDAFNGNLIAVFEMLMQRHDATREKMVFRLEGVHADLSPAEIERHKKHVLGARYDTLKDYVIVGGAKSAELQGTLLKVDPTQAKKPEDAKALRDSLQEKKLTPTVIQAQVKKINADVKNKDQLSLIMRDALKQIRQHEKDDAQRVAWSDVVIACLNAVRTDTDPTVLAGFRDLLVKNSKKSPSQFGATTALLFARDYLAKVTAEGGDYRQFVEDIGLDCCRQLMWDLAKQNKNAELSNLATYATAIPGDEVARQVLKHRIANVSNAGIEDLVGKIDDYDEIRKATELALAKYQEVVAAGGPNANAAREIFIALFKRAITLSVTFDSFDSAKRHAPFDMREPFYERVIRSNVDLTGVAFTGANGQKILNELIKAAARLDSRDKVSALCRNKPVDELEKLVKELNAVPANPAAAARVAFLNNGLLQKMADTGGADWALQANQLEAARLLVGLMVHKDVRYQPIADRVVALTQAILRSNAITPTEKRELISQIAQLAPARRGKALDQVTVTALIQGLGQNFGAVSPNEQFSHVAHVLPLLKDCAEKAALVPQNRDQMQLIVDVCNKILRDKKGSPAVTDAVSNVLGLYNQVVNRAQAVGPNVEDDLRAFLQPSAHRPGFFARRGTVNEAEELAELGQQLNEGDADAADPEAHAPPPFGLNGGL